MSVPKILTRIYINEEGDLIVTDMWEELASLVQGEPAESVNNEPC